MNGFALLIPEILLLAGALWALFAELLPGRDRGAAWAGAALGVAAGVVAAFQPLGVEVFGGSLVFDEQTRLARVAIALLTAVWLLWMSNRGAGEDRRREAVSLALFAAMGTMLVASAAELVTLFIAIEFATAPVYVLIGYNSRDYRSLEGALKYFLLSILTTLVMLYGFSFVYGLTGTTFLSRIDLIGTGWIGTVAAIFAITGLLAKMSAAPFHYWAPDAYSGSGAWVVAYASTVPKIGAAVALVRVALSLGGGVADLGLFLVLVAIGSMLLGNLVALPQNDVRRMMAYSGVGHAGYLLLGVAALDAAGGASAVLYSVVYAIPAMAIMMLAAEHGTQVSDWGRLALRRPAAAWATVIFLLSLVGIPPLVGFFGKFYVFASALNQGLWLGVVVAIVTSVVSAGYYLRIVRAAFFGEEPDVVITPARSVAADIAVFGLAVAVVALGVAAGPVLAWSGILGS